MNESNSHRVNVTDPYLNPPRMFPMRSLIDDLEDEASRSEAKFGPFASAHEGLGVLLEEFDELTDAIHANDREAVEREALQVAAVALRIARCCGLESFRERSGFAE